MKRVFLKIIKNIDDTTIKIINKFLRNKLFDCLMPTLTIIGYGGTIWFLVSIGLTIIMDNLKIGIMVITGLIISMALSEIIIKRTFKRTRPHNLKRDSKTNIRKNKDYSFPSGHTLTSFTSAQILTYLFPKYGFFFFLLAILISFSRIYLSDHYPTDVLASIILSFFVSNLVLLIFA